MRKQCVPDALSPPPPRLGMRLTFFLVPTVTTQAIHNDPNLVDTRRLFQQDCPPSLLELTIWH